MTADNYEAIFYPGKLAVIGASENPLKFGGLVMRALTDFGFKGDLYPVNPRGQSILGHKTYAKLQDVPGPVDFAVIAVPAPKVLDAVRSCVDKGVAGAEILAAGFREEGEAGKALERELVLTARAGGLRLIGPNGFGVYSPAAGLTLLPGVDFSREPGPVGLISQSGGGACDAIYMSRGRSVRFSIAVSLGNACDISVTEMLRYFEDDHRTRIVGAYIEGIDDGRDFFNALKGLAAKKPVVILKGGLSEQGPRGAAGHTGSMAGSRQAWEAAIKSAGAVMAKDIKDLTECLMAFNCLEGFSGRSAGILAGGGIRVVESLDWASYHGFLVPELDPETSGRLQALLPPAGGRGANPVDLANPMMSPSVIAPMMEILAKRPDIDFLALYQMLFYHFNEARRMGSDAFKIEFHHDLAKAAEEVREKTGKPTMVIMPDITSDPEHVYNEKGRMEARLHYTSRKIPCFDSADRAFSVLRRVADYYTGRGQSRFIG